jgi:hypothetical protein
MTIADQRLIALAHANEVRTGRRKSKADIRAGRVTVAELLADPPEHMRNATVLEFMLAMPRMGHRTAHRILRRSDVRSDTTFGTITPMRREWLIKELERPWPKLERPRS